MTESDVRGASEHLQMLATMLRQLQPVADESTKPGSLPLHGGAETLEPSGESVQNGVNAIMNMAADVPPPPPGPSTVPPPPSGEEPSQRAPGETLAPAIERTAAVEVELDKSGVAWDAALHAGNKAKKQDGTWKARRGSGTTATPSAPAATFVQVQMAMGGLLAKGVDLAECEKAISIAVSGNEDTRTGGMTSLKVSNDSAGCELALQALKALAVTSGV